LNNPLPAFDGHHLIFLPVQRIYQLFVTLLPQKSLKFHQRSVSKELLKNFTKNLTKHLTLLIIMLKYGRVRYKSNIKSAIKYMNRQFADDLGSCHPEAKLKELACVRYISRVGQMFRPRCLPPLLSGVSHLDDCDSKTWGLRGLNLTE
jgi:hypothetical protein